MRPRFCRSPPVMIAGGRVFVLPCVQQIQRISLNTLTLNVKSDKVYTRHGMKIQGQNKQMLAAACQMFMGKSEGEIAHIALETLEGHQRAIIAHLTVEEIYRDRKKFSEEVFKVASSDLVNMGISVVSYTLKDVHDDQYLKFRGVLKDAALTSSIPMLSSLPLPPVLFLCGVLTSRAPCGGTGLLLVFLTHVNPTKPIRPITSH
ncbi:hypothetical protein DPEC_G00362920 [Dallia pectoralis]|nr:hypothetical protein DPEC_G00362920 [Dallia pectoralis]